MRRLAGAILSAALLAAPAGAGVPGMMSAGDQGSPVRTHPLAPGEQLLEVGGIGFVMARADLATLSVSISTGGANQAAARRANRAEVRRAIEALRRAGIPADAIRTQEGLGFPRTVDVTETMPPPDLATDPAYDVTTLTIRLSDIDRVDAVRVALREAGADNISGPAYTIADRGPARRRAQAQALAAARADAEASAAQANMRIVRLVRVTERVGGDLFTIALNNEALFRGLRNMPSPSEPQTQPDIPVLVLLGADYALAPR
jgi:uncharacterized protein